MRAQCLLEPEIRQKQGRSLGKSRNTCVPSIPFDICVFSLPPLADHAKFGFQVRFRDHVYAHHEFHKMHFISVIKIITIKYTIRFNVDTLKRKDSITSEILELIGVIFCVYFQVMECLVPRCHYNNYVSSQLIVK